MKGIFSKGEVLILGLILGSLFSFGIRDRIDRKQDQEISGISQGIIEVQRSLRSMREDIDRISGFIGIDPRSKGIASWYGPGFHGRETANQEIFDQESMTAAHRFLPFGSILEVRNLLNSRATIVRINDRGPFIQGRIVDLSRKAAEEIGMIDPGTAPVSIRRIR